jgi:hypothetical protein
MMMGTERMPERLVGITVMPEYYQDGSIEGVLDNLTGLAHATAVTTSPYVMAPVTDGTGQREPPIDAGAGKVRLLDRPLWGRRELWVRSSPSFIADRGLYKGGSYQPPEADDLTESEGAIVGGFLDAATRRGLATYLQVQAAIPPGYRVQFGGPHDDDLPLLPDGSPPGKRVAANASLAAPEVQAYQRAMITDLVRQYPQVNGFRFDWPEYPPYEIDSIFTDFNPAVVPVAIDLGLVFSDLQAEVGRVYDYLKGHLVDQDVQRIADGMADYPGGSAAEFINDQSPLLGDWLKLKRALSDRLLRSFRAALDDAGRPDVELVAHAFPPPWSDLSGIDFSGSADVVDHFCVKLYGMHWLMMLRSYADQLLEDNPELHPKVLLRALYLMFDVSIGRPPSTIEEVRYPSPHDPHPGEAVVRERKIAAAQARAGETPVVALEHGYGPVDDFTDRIKTAYRASGSRIWINRYGYLSDEKLARIGHLSIQGG